MYDEFRQTVKYILKNHPGKLIGFFSGLSFGILVLTIGFFKTIFLVLCILIGLWLGNTIDRDGIDYIKDFLSTKILKHFN